MAEQEHHDDDGTEHSGDNKHSVLDDLGAEVTGIAFPVSVCMAITIALVRVLHSNDGEDRQNVIIAEALYNEKVCYDLPA